jgi:hypothetical protein
LAAIAAGSASEDIGKLYVPGRAWGRAPIILPCMNPGETPHKQKPQRLAIVAAFDNAFLVASALSNCGYSRSATIILHDPSHFSVAIDFAQVNC